jgi:hypothetical protein
VLNSEPTAAAIATPMLRHSDAVLAVDLWLSDREAAGARAGLEELTDLIERDALLAFLAAAHPFGQLAAPEAAAMPSTPTQVVLTARVNGSNPAVAAPRRALPERWWRRWRPGSRG